MDGNQADLYERLWNGLTLKKNSGGTNPEKSADQNLGTEFVTSTLTTEISGTLFSGTVRNGIDPIRVPTCYGRY